MSTETVKLTGPDLLWYAAAAKAAQTGAPATAAPAPTKKRAWKRHLMVMLALVSLKLMVIAGSDGIEVLTFWLNDTRGLLGWP